MRASTILVVLRTQILVWSTFDWRVKHNILKLGNLTISHIEAPILGWLICRGTGIGTSNLAEIGYRYPRVTRFTTPRWYPFSTNTIFFLSFSYFTNFVLKSVSFLKFLFLGDREYKIILHIIRHSNTNDNNSIHTKFFILLKNNCHKLKSKLFFLFE